VEDDEDDFLMIKNAFIESNVKNEIRWLPDGEKLLALLKEKPPVSTKHSGKYIILLDLNLPKRDGREVLKELKSDPNLRMIPVIVITTSKSSEDMKTCYKYGANTFIVKPSDYAKFVSFIRAIVLYWLEVAEITGICDNNKSDENIKQLPLSYKNKTK
ncbi:MAG: response regulator, partial [Planctomycetes bacterium]|nr:response regulator [Planctomycetota bacterium]